LSKLRRPLNVIHGNDRFIKFNRARGNSAEHPEIDEPEQFRAGSILKGTRSQFGAKRGGKKRRWSRESQFKEPIHMTNQTSKTLKLALKFPFD
jgi:hypothetical protein